LPPPRSDSVTATNNPNPEQTDVHLLPITVEDKSQSTPSGLYIDCSSVLSDELLIASYETTTHKRCAAVDDRDNKDSEEEVDEDEDKVVLVDIVDLVDDFEV
jgi:hypothetical protein